MKLILSLMFLILGIIALIIALVLFFEGDVYRMVLFILISYGLTFSAWLLEGRKRGKA